MTEAEEEMRLALFGSTEPAGVPKESKAQPSMHAKERSAKPQSKRFVPKLKVTLRVGNEYEGQTELFTHEADTLSQLQAELDAKKLARKKFRYIELISVVPAR